MAGVAVAIVDDLNLGADEKLGAALDRADLWGILADRRHALGRSLRVVVKPDFCGFAPEFPAVTTPALVEALTDALFDHGYADVTIAATTEPSALWAENRDAFALAELLGYHIVTSGGRAYEIADLSSDCDRAVFPPSSALRDLRLSSVWADADVRIVFAKCKTDEHDGFALCLDSLIGVLPHLDKRLHYRAARDAGEAVADLIDATPVHFALIDAVMSAHGAGGRRAPEAIETATIIACRDVVLADQIGALKMSLDPTVSPVFASAAARRPPPRRYEIVGELKIYPGWRNVPAPLARSTRFRAQSGTVERLVEPWLQRLDPELFPLKSPIDAQVNSAVARFFEDADASPTGGAILLLANLVLGFAGQCLENWRILVCKDTLRQKAIGLNVDPRAFESQSFEDLVEELEQVRHLAEEAPEASEGLRWLTLNGAVVFAYVRALPIAFETFVDRVDVARTIEFMNDYLGGVVVALERDHEGRPVRQIERNLYLPQPNWVAVYGGKPIDVTKLEVVDYAPDRRRLYWKTVFSENGSAKFDDGVAEFSRSEAGVTITIAGRQLFELPPFLKLVDENLTRGLKTALVTSAYRTFFDRTIANLEALVEGREIRLGRPPDAPEAPLEERIRPIVEKASGLIEPIVRSFLENGERRTGSRPAIVADADGFVHGQGGVLAQTQPQWRREVDEFLSGLTEAMARDLRRSAR